MVPQRRDYAQNTPGYTRIVEGLGSHAPTPTVHSQMQHEHGTVADLGIQVGMLRNACATQIVCLRDYKVSLPSYKLRVSLPTFPSSGVITGEIGRTVPRGSSCE